MLLFSHLAKITYGHVAQIAGDKQIQTFITDSRKAIVSESACFFAIEGERHDGHVFIDDLYRLGIRQFVVEKELPWSNYPDANFFLTNSSIRALQAIAVQHREQFHFPVVGITGSNGKTIIKEWLFQLLSPDFSIVKNPGSYNSQLGVPLSVLQMQPHHNLGIFEAGISKPGEMENLAKIIQPSIGILTTVGTAHDEGFKDRKEKIREKLKLFENAEVVIYSDRYGIQEELQHQKSQTVLSWGSQPDTVIQTKLSGPELTIFFKKSSHKFLLPFSDTASVENLTHCIVLMLLLGLTEETIQQRITHLKAVPMRLEMKRGVNQCQIIDDTYNNDLAGLQISLDFLASQPKKKKTLILSDILQSGLKEEELVKRIASIVSQSGIHKFTGIGPVLTKHKKHFQLVPHSEFLPSTEEFLLQNLQDQFQGEAVLVKGARTFQFERIVQRLQQKIHGTVMEIDLDALVHNLNFFKARLKPDVKLMVMVKAFAYGSGSEEVANLLQYHKIDYLGVAYADEGMMLRKNNITLPIMVMNPSEESFPALMQYGLEPEVYSLKILQSLIGFLNGQPCAVHIKLDTGMHRLGFDQSDLAEAIRLLKSNTNLRIASVFSHLAGADESQHDEFSKMQAENFNRLYEQIRTELNINPDRHVLNSPGILRFPQYQFEMVRLGIGLYGINPTEEKIDGLKPVATLKTIISQIKKIGVGESIGYGRKGKAEKEMTIATIAIGYADGFSRSFSRGKGVVLINGKRAPVIGNVCMDMTMIDIAGIDAKEGDDVIVFGKELPIQDVAESINTISYEILTNTSERVKRVFYAESF